MTQIMFEKPLEIASLMREFKPDWFVAGGWAIDLFLGKETREHQDLEIAIFRKDQKALREYFDGWLFLKIVTGEPIVWDREEWLTLPIHEIHCSNKSKQTPSIEILLNESDEAEWIYRRNPNVRRSLDKIELQTDAGVKFLCPEIVLLYKSKNPREKDELDFQQVVKHLDAERKEWLRDAIGACNSEHRWLASL